jgi:Zn-dependent peptidase ImmA (M78 family)/transcriptional regulator with XRE-family HTH domain
MGDFNPGRLDLARKRRGLTKIGLANAAGVSRRILSAYEDGQKEPSPQTVARIAEALEFPIEFFSGFDLDEPPIYGSSFRALSNLTARQRDQALGSGALALALADWIDVRFVLPKPDVPRLHGVDPETAAESVRGAWGLGERPIRNMIHLMESHGVRVFSLAEECLEVDAFSFWRAGVPYVFLNTTKSAEHSRMDAAHELGHLVQHWSHESPRGRDAEFEAKRFASAFLMPSGSVLAEAPRGARLDQLIDAKRRWDVSLAALVYRMHVLGLLSDWHYRSLFVEISERGYRRSEPNGGPRETSQVLDKVFKSLHNQGVSRRSVARQLGIPLQELNKLVFGLVLISVGEGIARPDSWQTKQALLWPV